MRKTFLVAGVGLALTTFAIAYEVMTPEKLWQLQRVSPMGLNKAQTHVIYRVTAPSIENNDAIDDVAKESYVDKDRNGALGASFGGYSAFYLAGNHDGRFKTFISHCGVFDTRSMYGTTEEMFFVNHDFGGAYWEADNAAASKAYAEFNPITYVDQWDAPMFVIHGGKDHRGP